MFVKERVSEKRYQHSVAVAKASRWLAFKYGANEDDAVIAGILHDITKEWCFHDHLTFLHAHNIGLSSYEYASVKLLHAITGACYAKLVLRINEVDILNAIRFHTTARAGMSTLEKIVYLADGISEDRKYSGVNELRYIADYSLDDAVFKEISSVIADELVRKERLVHPDTLNAYNEIILKREKEKETKLDDFQRSDYINVDICHNQVCVR